MKNKIILAAACFYSALGFAAPDKLAAPVSGATEEIQLSIEGPDGDPFNIPDSVKVYQNQRKVAELRRKYCKKYDKKYISYYDNIYYVESCKRRSVESNQAQYDLTSRGSKIEIIDADVIAVIPEGQVINHLSRKKMRNCKSLNKKYVTFSDVDVYYVDNCKLKIFPDWDSYVFHRKKRGVMGEIVALEWEEFSSFFEFDKDGELKSFEPLKSVIDEEYLKAKDIETEVDIIPVDEACRGLNGRWVSFYSRMYKIENCYKRELDPELFWQKNKGRGAQLKVLELIDEQWISLPDGKPWP